jgi:L-rhamnose mutarotase
MRREAFKMYLKPGCEVEYAKRHNAIWPELKQLLKDSGVSDYTIFWDRETNVPSFGQILTPHASKLYKLRKK